MGWGAEENKYSSHSGEQGQRTGPAGHRGGGKATGVNAWGSAIHATHGFEKRRIRIKKGIWILLSRPVSIN